MTREKTKAITRDRLFRWAARLAAQNATPILLLGVGHGEQTGDLVVLTVEDLSGEYIRGCLRFALKQLGGQAP